MDALIEEAGLYLARQLREDGSFHYGVFPVSHEAIPTYNILRHSSTLYAMLEAWEATGNGAIAAGRADRHRVRDPHRAGAGRPATSSSSTGPTSDEVRLGAQAAFILAVAKFTALTGDRRISSDLASPAGRLHRRALSRPRDRPVRRMSSPRPIFR